MLYIYAFSTYQRCHCIDPLNNTHNSKINENISIIITEKLLRKREDFLKHNAYGEIYSGSSQIYHPQTICGFTNYRNRELNARFMSNSAHHCTG